jgi:hypothetical protein
MKITFKIGKSTSPKYTFPKCLWCGEDLKILENVIDFNDKEIIFKTLIPTKPISVLPVAKSAETLVEGICKIDGIYIIKYGHWNGILHEFCFDHISLMIFKKIADEEIIKSPKVSENIRKPTEEVAKYVYEFLKKHRDINSDTRIIKSK